MLEEGHLCVLHPYSLLITLPNPPKSLQGTVKRWVSCSSQAAAHAGHALAQKHMGFQISELLPRVGCTHLTRQTHFLWSLFPPITVASECFEVTTMTFQASLVLPGRYGYWISVLLYDSPRPSAGPGITCLLGIGAPKVHHLCSADPTKTR